MRIRQYVLRLKATISQYKEVLEFKNAVIKNLLQQNEELQQTKST